jgi:hypothetical protein
MRLDHMTPMERDLPTGRLQRRKEHLVSELRTWDRTVRRRRRRLGFVLVPAVLVLLGVTGFTTYQLTREPTHLESIGCYDKASLDANVAVVDADGSDPTDICGAVWRTGAFGHEGDHPQLAACVLQTGAVGVFPSSGGQTCETLGLADLPASYAAKGTQFAILRNAIVARVGEPASGSTLGGPQCLGEDEARLIVRRELVTHGFGDWDVKVAGEPFSAARPCADVSFDSAGKTVLLVAVGPRS